MNMYNRRTLPQFTVVAAPKIMCQYYSSFWLGFQS